VREEAFSGLLDCYALRDGGDGVGLEHHALQPLPGHLLRETVATAGLADRSGGNT
jgi:hypothetical protein